MIQIQCHNPQQAHAAMMAQVWPVLKAQTTAGHRMVLTLKPETRSSQQNRYLHAIFGDIAKQSEWMGKKRSAAEWKVLMVSGHSVATKQGAELVPGLEGEFINIRESTARMGKARMASLLEYTLAWCAMNDIKLIDARQWAVDPDTGEVLG